MCQENQPALLRWQAYHVSGNSVSEEGIQPNLGGMWTLQAKRPSEVIPAKAVPIPTLHPRMGPDSQVEDQVMVSLLGDAVVEPDCRRGQGSWLRRTQGSPLPASLSPLK